MTATNNQTAVGSAPTSESTEECPCKAKARARRRLFIGIGIAIVISGVVAYFIYKRRIRIIT